MVNLIYSQAMFKLKYLCFLVYFTTTSVAYAAEVVVSPDSLSSQSHIRIIAASCAACHGTHGNSVGTTPSLAGLDGSYFVQKMLAYKQGEGSPTVMHHHAQGLNVDEINLLALYFARQIPASKRLLKPQTLEASHD